MPGKRTTKSIRIEMCEAGRLAAVQLISVAKASIFNNQNDDGVVSNEDLASEKMKIAAQAKKVSIFDCFDILDKVDSVESKMKDEEPKAEGEPVKEKKVTSTKKSNFNGVEDRS